MIWADWSNEDQHTIYTQKWDIDGDDDWYREYLSCSHLILDDWTCESLVEAINKDIEDKLSVEQILEKYVKS